jgi:beta-glucanase (GH16 family)
MQIIRCNAVVFKPKALAQPKLFFVPSARLVWGLSSSLMAVFLFFAIMGAASVACAQTTVEEFNSLSWDISHRGAPLNLAQYNRTFFDDFDVMRIASDDGRGHIAGNGLWYAPGRGDAFGASKFYPPGPDGPFSVKDGKLTITAKRVDGQWWRSGNMQTVNSKGEGFAQQYGYFEMRAKFPPGPGGWPAFWLVTQNAILDKKTTYAEIDILEWYGGDPKGHHSTVHLWPGENTQLAKHVFNPYYYDFSKARSPVLVNGRLEGFHTYGAEVTSEWVIVYFDRSEVARFKTLPEFKQPLYMLVTLAIFEPQQKIAESPKEMTVDYVSAYQHQ